MNGRLHMEGVFFSLRAHIGAVNVYACSESFLVKLKMNVTA